jgi:hypothetical protein
MTLLADSPAAIPAAPAAPVLRLRPIPVSEPRPALGVLPAPQPPGPVGQVPLPFPDSAGTGSAAPPAERSRPALPVAALPAAGLPEPQEWATRFARVALEVVTGLRPPGQLVRWTTPAVLAALTRRHALAQRGGGRPPRSTVRSVRVCEPAGGVAEVAAVVADGHRVRALAVRMEGEGGRWRVVAFDLG